MCICTNKESKEKKGTCKHTGSGAASTCSCNCDDCLDCRGHSCKKNCKPAAGNLSICKASQGNTLTVGQRDQVSAHFNCGYSGNRHIGWRSSNPNVVKVDCYGNLTAVGEGYACIYAYVYGNSSVYDRITIHVTANGSSSGSGSGSSGENMTIDLLDNEFRPLAETLSDSPWVMYIGDQYQFNAMIRNKVGTPKLEWSSSDPGVLLVDETGFVTAKDKGMAILRVSIKQNSAICELPISIEVGPNLVYKEQLEHIGWLQSQLTDAYIDDLNRTLKKYSITTTERIRHFLTQCFAESGTRLPLEAGTNKYRGSGAIQITNEYNYKAFATLMLTTNFPDLPIVFLSPAHNNKTSISNMYEYAVTEAESLSIDEEKLKKFTDIVTLGAEYVSINFVWESAGYFWLANDLESMVDSFPVNSSAHVDYVTAVVNSNSNNYERRGNIYMIVAQYII